MNPQSINLKPIPLNENSHGYTHIDARIYYDKGGYTYSCYDNEPRGYYLSIFPVKKENRDGYVITQGSPRDGIRYFLKDAARFSTKTLNELAGDITIQQLIDSFEIEHGYTEAGASA